MPKKPYIPSPDMSGIDWTPYHDDFETIPGMSSSRFQRTPEERERRLKGYVQGESPPGRLARHAFESRPSRVAYMRPEGILRGNVDDIHMNVMARHIPELQGIVEGPGFRGRIGPQEADERKFWRAFEDLPDETLDDWESTAGFTGRGGEFTSRSEAMAGRGESFILRDAEMREGAATTKAILRADSQHERDQVLRSMKTKRTRDALSLLREERSFLENANRYFPDAAASDRIKFLTRKIGALKNSAIRKGLIGIGLATIGSNETINEALGFGAVERAAKERYGIE